jgi:hypothetical protein
MMPAAALAYALADDAHREALNLARGARTVRSGRTSLRRSRSTPTAEQVTS